MDNAEFTVNTSDWKVFYKMKYDGEKSRLIAFSTLVDGTCLFATTQLEPAVEVAAQALAEDFGELEEQLAKMARAARKHLKKQGLSKDPYLEMAVLRTALQQLGAKTALEKKELKKSLKKL